MRKDIYKAINGYNTFPIYITGHSLGGALATLCSLDLNMNLYNNTTTVTIGSPRVGNKAFIDMYNMMVGNSYRVKNYGDIISHFPMRFNYRHVHPSVCMNEGKTLKEKIYKKFLRRLWNCIVSIQFGNIYEKHSLEKYKENVRKLNNST